MSDSKMFINLKGKEVKNRDLPLWSDNKSEDDIQLAAEANLNEVIYNLHEDILCLKADLKKAQDENARLTYLSKKNPY